MTLTDFLLERIAEDEAAAKAAIVDGGSWFARYPEQPDCHMYGEFGWVVSGPGVETEDSEWGKGVADHIARHDPARALAECEAKRQIVEKCAYATDEAFAGDYDLAPRYDLGDSVLRALASVYADHRDYRQEWKP